MGVASGGGVQPHQVEGVQVVGGGRAASAGRREGVFELTTTATTKRFELNTCNDTTLIYYCGSNRRMKSLKGQIAELSSLMLIMSCYGAERFTSFLTSLLFHPPPPSPHPRAPNLSLYQKAVT